MASTQDLKRRVRSITNTRKVTKAMELVASARLRRSQQRIESMRPYADRMLELMAGVSQAAGAVRLPLLERRENVQRVAIVPITADRGLAGGFNAQVIRRSLALMREVEANGQEAVWFSTGRKAASTLRFRRLNVSQSWVGFSERPAYSDAQAIAHAVSEAYVNKEIDRVVIVYNAFVSALVQKVTVRDLLPVPQDLLDKAAEAEEDSFGGTPDFIYEPEPEEILARLLPVYVETELYRALLESAASEQGARMTAMRNASKAAGELIDSLTLAMNRARQAEITQEILEVVAGADALSG
ncbi:MAG: F-type H+-transporting ATPase subunit gamma [Gaiellaceae bacterium]|nr:F-type H+-transporting ATPase subunit gamma [Gaiellaceae bacterium]